MPLCGGWGAGRNGSGRGSGRGRDRPGKRNDDGWEEWGGYMQAKVQKLELHNITASVESNIFKGVSVFVNGYTDPSSDEIKKLVISNGGSYHHYYSRTRVTHIIASNLPSSKINQIRDEKVVKPDWIVDSLKAGKLLSYHRYLLYKPESVINQNTFFQAKSPPLVESAAQSSSLLQSSADNLVTGGFSAQSTGFGLGTSSTACVEQSNIRYESADLDYIYSLPKCGDGQNVSPGNLSGVKEDHCEVDEAYTSHQILNSFNNSDRNDAGHVGDAVAGSMSSENKTKVSEFFSHSRLHYLSTWCAESKEYVAQLQCQDQPNLPGCDRLRHVMQQRSVREIVDSEDGITEQKSHEQSRPRFQKLVMHVDMDCFFVSVGLQSRPDLRGKPVAVTHSKGRGPLNQAKQAAELEALWRKKQDKTSSLNGGVQEEPSLVGVKLRSTEEKASFEDIFGSMAEIASCSYEARQAGIKNGMFFGRAKQLCPDLIPIPYDFEAYKRVSRLLYDTVASYTHDIEAVSCDELFVDCADVLANTGASCLDFAELLRQEIFEKTGCTASVGIGSNMLQARMATRAAKPNGQFWLTPENVEIFLRDTTVSDLPGVGYSLKARLAELGVSTCGELQLQSLQLLQNKFGVKTGQLLYNRCRGIDDRVFQVGAARKSVSAEMNYGIRFSSVTQVDNFLGELAAEVQRRMARLKVACKLITLKLKIRQQGAPKETSKFMGHGICDSICKSSRLPVATDKVSAISSECRSLIRKVSVDPSDLRGIGIQLSVLEPVQGGLPSPSLLNSSSGCRNIRDFVAQVYPTVTTTSSLTSTSSSVDGRKSSSKAVTHCTSASGQRNLNCVPSLPKSPEADLDIRSSTAVTPPPQCSSRDDTWCLPSPSQVDLDVLRELPADIRESIEQALKCKDGVHSSTLQPDSLAYAGACSEPDLKAGCSFWNSVNQQDRILTSLPSFSQIDFEVLKALPEDIQHEIQAAYRVQSPEKHLHPLMQRQPETIKSPSKTSPKKSGSPGKAAGGPFKAPIGHPPRRRKLDMRKIAPLDVYGEKLAPGTDGATLNEMKTMSKTAADTHKFSLVQDATVDVPVVMSESLFNIKCMIREWIESCSEPRKEDQEAFVSCLVQLVYGYDLEKFDSIVKFLQRQTQQESVGTSWKESGKWIIDQAQTVVQSTYGGTLKLTTH